MLPPSGFSIPTGLRGPAGTCWDLLESKFRPPGSFRSLKGSQISPPVSWKSEQWPWTYSCGNALLNQIIPLLNRAKRLESLMLHLTDMPLLAPQILIVPGPPAQPPLSIQSVTTHSLHYSTISFSYMCPIYKITHRITI